MERLATTPTSEMSIPREDHHTRRAEWRYSPDEDTAWANFSSVFNWASISRRIRCSSSDSGTSRLSHPQRPNTMHGGVFKVPFLFFKDRTEWIFTWSAPIKAACGPDDSDSELIHNGVHRLACWLPLLFNIFRTVAALIE